MTPKIIQSFRNNLVRNNLVTILCVLLVLVCFILNYLERRQERQERMEYAYYVDANGAVIPAQYALRRDNIEIEIRHHLAMFVDNWYELTQYNWEQKAEAAGWLGGNSIREIFISRRKDGFFNRFIQSNITQSAQITDVQITPNADGTFAFEMIVDIQEKDGTYMQPWRVLASGTISVIERSWPHNPHGLWIEPYLENKIINTAPNE